MLAGALAVLLYLAAACLALVGLRYALALRRVLALRLQADCPWERIAPEDVPEALPALFEAPGRELGELGFEAFGWMRQAAASDELPPMVSQLYRHASGRAYAFLHESFTPTRSQPCGVAFLSLAEDARQLLTVSFQFLLGWQGLKKHECVDARTLSLAEQWRRHEAELASRADFAPRDVSADELIAERVDSERRAHEHMLARGAHAVCADGRVRLRPRAALALVWGATRAATAKRKALARLAQQSPVEAGTAAATAEADGAAIAAAIAAHGERERTERTRARRGWLPKLALFGGSALLFAFAFGLSLSPATLALLAAVLLAHELGHALAMKYFGYRDLQVLFIPFLGALVTGEKRVTKPHEEVAVLLAGPVPGIAAGTLLYALGADAWAPWLGDAAQLLLVLNGFNLLPLLPLDGGQILNRLVFDRFPRAEAVFSGASSLAIAGGALWLEQEALAVLGLLLLLSLPVQLRRANTLLAARARLVGVAERLDPSAALRAIYAELVRPRFDGWNAEMRYRLAADLQARLIRPVAGAAFSAVVLAGWLLVLVLPLGFVLHRPALDMQAALAELEASYTREQAEWQGRLAAAATQVEQVRARLGAGEHALRAGRDDDARAQLDAAASLVRALGEPELEATVELRRGELALTARSGALDALSRRDANRHLQRALDLRESVFGPESLEVAEVLEAFPPEPAGERAAALVRQLRLIAIYERARASDAAHLWPLVRACERASLARAELGDLPRAEAALVRAVAAAEAGAEPERGDALGLALATLTDFYLEQGRYADARALLARRAPPGSGGALLEADRCWLAYWEGDLAGARGCFAALRASLAASTPADDWSELAALPLLLDLALATERAGDPAEAQRLLAETRAAVERSARVDLAEYARAFMGASGGDADGGWSARQSLRRFEERRRVLAPLLGPNSAPAL